MESELYRIIMLGVLLACNITCLVLVYQARAQFKRDSQARTQKGQAHLQVRDTICSQTTRYSGHYIQLDRMRIRIKKRINIMVGRSAKRPIIRDIKPIWR